MEQNGNYVDVVTASEQSVEQMSQEGTDASQNTQKEDMETSVDRVECGVVSMRHIGGHRRSETARRQAVKNNLRTLTNGTN